VIILFQNKRWIFRSTELGFFGKFLRELGYNLQDFSENIKSRFDKETMKLVVNESKWGKWNRDVIEFVGFGETLKLVRVLDYYRTMESRQISRTGFNGITVKTYKMDEHFQHHLSMTQIILEESMCREKQGKPIFFQTSGNSFCFPFWVANHLYKQISSKYHYKVTEYLENIKKYVGLSVSRGFEINILK